MTRSCAVSSPIESTSVIHTSTPASVCLPPCMRPKSLADFTALMNVKSLGIQDFVCGTLGAGDPSHRIGQDHSLQAARRPEGVSCRPLAQPQDETRRMRCK